MNNGKREGGLSKRQTVKSPRAGRALIELPNGMPEKDDTKINCRKVLEERKQVHKPRRPKEKQKKREKKTSVALVHRQTKPPRNWGKGKWGREWKEETNTGKSVSGLREGKKKESKRS